MIIKNYNNFIQDKRVNKLIKETVGINLIQTNEEIFNDVFESLLNKVSDENIKNELVNYINYTQINEDFFTKLKDRFPKASQVSNLLSDKAEKVLSDILQKSKDMVAFISDISSKIKQFFIDSIEQLKENFIELIKNGKLKEKISSLNDKDKEGLHVDIKTGRSVIKWYRTEFLQKFLSSFSKNSSEFFGKEQEPIAESMLNEGGNVIATLVHGLEKYPPFSWLHKVQQAGEAGANKLVDVLSEVTVKMGGPKFTLPVIAALLGVVLEQMVKGQVGHGLLDLFGATTPLGMAIKGLKMVAMFIAFIVAVDAVIGEKILGGGHGEHDNHKKPGVEMDTKVEANEKPKVEVEATSNKNVEDKNTNNGI